MYGVFFFRLFVCLFAFVYASVPHVLCPKNGEEGISFSRTAVRGGCEVPRGLWEPTLDLLKDPQVL